MMPNKEKKQKSTAEVAGRREFTLLAVGEWRAWQYGYEVEDWCVLRIADDKVKVCLESWLVSDAMWVNKDDFIRHSEPLGMGKFKCWRYLLPWRDCVIPFSMYR